MPAGAKVLIATDADRAGDEHAETMSGAVERAHLDAVVERARPPECKDWNDVLCEHAQEGPGSKKGRKGRGHKHKGPRAGVKSWCARKAWALGIVKRSLT